MQTRLRPAPDWQVTKWFNTPTPLTLSALRGKVVVLHAFQMLCPGCVRLGLPQAQQVHDTFPRDQVAVVGLHTVFEHHAAMTPVALEAFLHEYRITFPVGVDAPGTGHLPRTMEAYGFQGTPSLVLVDRQGRLRKHSFGHEPDLRLGAEIMALLAEAPDASLAAGTATGEGGCTPAACPAS